MVRLEDTRIPQGILQNRLLNRGEDQSDLPSAPLGI
jgi:hypothetical protein